MSQMGYRQSLPVDGVLLMPRLASMSELLSKVTDELTDATCTQCNKIFKLPKDMETNGGFFHPHGKEEECHETRDGDHPLKFYIGNVSTGDGWVSTDLEPIVACGECADDIMGSADEIIGYQSITDMVPNFYIVPSDEEGAAEFMIGQAL